MLNLCFNNAARYVLGPNIGQYRRTSPQQRLLNAFIHNARIRTRHVISVNNCLISACDRRLTDRMECPSFYGPIWNVTVSLGSLSEVSSDSFLLCSASEVRCFPLESDFFPLTPPRLWSCSCGVERRLQGCGNDPGKLRSDVLSGEVGQTDESCLQS